MGDVYCPVDNSIVQKTYDPRFNKHATKSYLCNACGAGMGLCVVCGEVTLGFLGAEDHIESIHGRGQRVEINTGKTIVYKRLSTFPGLNHLLYLKQSNQTPERVDVASISDAPNLIHKKDYFCIFCDAGFDCLPSKEMVNVHLSQKCPALRAMPKASHSAGCGARVGDSRWPRHAN